MPTISALYSDSNSISRRSFLAVSGVSLLSAALSQRAAGMPAARGIEKIGVQLYTVRDEIAKDLDGSLARIAAIGYREVELAGYASHSVARFRAALDRHGLVAPSSHIAIERIRDELPQVLEEAHELGHRYVICPNIADEKEGLDGYRKTADILNHAGEIASRSQVSIGYHNHESELAPIEGLRPFDVLLDRTEPSLVSMEMDVFWLVAGGGDPFAYFRKYPGRFRMLHVKDMDATPTHGMTDVGSGTIDWSAIFVANPEIEHYFVEHDFARDPFSSISASYRYLSKLEF
jgi:sugar phosphate isomerase/epimerase